MGREARCKCNWAGEVADCKVLMESGELIVRGTIRRRVLLASLTGVSVNDEQLTFRVGQDNVALSLGSELAKRWAKAIAAPPPSLAKKLGITRASNLLLIGKVQDEELKVAVAEAGAVGGKEVNLILACVNTPAELNSVLEQCSAHAAGGSPLWIIYPKGPGKPLSESSVLTLLRSQSYTDTKVASVSANLTALRFVKRAA